MILIFHRRVHKAKSSTEPDTVSAKIVTTADGEFVELGTLNFPNKMMWSKFIAAFQRGVMPIKDMEVEIENVPDKDIPDNPPGDSSDIPCKDENIVTKKVPVK